ncbi:MAG: ATP-binding protein [Flavobacteriales bacterium]
MWNRSNIAGSKVFIIALVLLLIAIAIHSSFGYLYRYNALQKNTLNSFDVVKENAEKHLSVLKNIGVKSAFESNQCDQLWLNEQIQLFGADRSGMLEYWSGNEVTFDPAWKDFDEESIILLKNGWYYLLKQEHEKNYLFAAVLLAHQFPYENDYLISSPSDYFPSAYRLHFNHQNGIPLKTKSGELLLYVDVSLVENFGDFYNNLTVALLLISFGFLLIGIGQFLLTRPPNRFFLYWAISAALLFFARQIGIFFRFPDLVYQSRLFSPQDYATSTWLPSLGDFFLNSLLLFYLIYLAYLYLLKSPETISKIARINLPSRFFSPFLILASATGSYYLIQSLIINSSIPLNFNDILSFNHFSVIALAVVALLLGTHFFLCRIIFLFTNRANKLFLLAFYVSACIIFIVVGIILKLNLIFPVLWGFCSFWLGFILLYLHPERNYTLKTTSLVVLYAIACTWIVKDAEKHRREERQKILAVKLSEERDPIAEFLFQDVEERIINDELLRSYLDPANAGSMPSRDLAQLFFNGYWDKYSIEVNTFGVDECPLTNLYSNKVNDPEYFERLIDSISIPTTSKNFFFLDNASGKISYLARIPISQKDDTNEENLGIIYISFDSRYTPEEIGYPELLLDKIATTSLDPSDYSNARYKDGRLTRNFGSFIYPSSDAAFRETIASEGEFYFVEMEGFRHLIYRADKDSLVIISYRNDRLLDYLTPFSYLFLIFSVLSLFFTVLTNKELTEWRYLLTFKRKVQFSVMLLILSALLLIGSATVYFIIGQNEQKNDRILSEKIYSVLSQLEQWYGTEQSLNPYLSDDISFRLSRLANTFFSDINIYDRNGNLFASSRKKVFEEGLLSKNMNPAAYRMLTLKTFTELLQDEQIGKLRYRSAYVNLRNNEGETLGYVNLPYFARQSELRKEISGFLVAIININVLLLVIVVIAAIIISNSVTEPLRLIREKLGAVKLTTRNEKIEWEGEDEIGDLVSEYNRMVDKLVQSAEMLARSERESAWREMAKQVAHEIKNPLTPMKLSLQHLKRAYDDGSPDWDERLERFTRTMIEQIESLSAIATEFSNFAKMPKLSREHVELKMLLQTACDLFAQENNVTVVQHLPAAQVFVMADKEQLLRAFNNLIKNAIQASENQENGQVDVYLSLQGQKVIIEIRDNGHGINEEIREKIFQPNFTTKSSGTGLGLALVKSIVTGCDGNVWFESSPETGTSFFIELNVID